MPDQSTDPGPSRAGCLGILGAWIVLAIVGVIIIHRAMGWPWGPMTPVAVVVTLAGSFFTMMWIRIRGLDAVREQFERKQLEVRARVGPLSVDEARRRALRHLHDLDKFECRRGKASDSELMRLGPEMRRFFAEFESIAGLLSLSRSEIRDSDNVPNCIVIGDLYGDGHSELLAKPNDDRVYFVHLEDPALEIVEHAPSIWHCILLESEADEG